MSTAQEQREDLVTQVALLKQAVINLDSSMGEHKAEQVRLVLAVGELNRTWNQAAGAITFIKWLATAITLLTAALVAFKAFVLHPPT